MFRRQTARAARVPRRAGRPARDPAAAPSPSSRLRRPRPGGEAVAEGTQHVGPGVRVLPLIARARSVSGGAAPSGGTPVVPPAVS